ncbi:hypothetical protein SMSP2_02076 [Limihaloglobus sulfuriphilus]|uniref:Uncharacterized protein n=1 Tax=Limihaloglobus sulfuriphilus TaxID=1851148 RepID=A0A1Q2MGC8_9BACT|nr:hypothetical protein [Limihaloglobus sulfuriphilus]AQQ71699.1 hypothetical protein SMSP2_02076 [Limihaloglobus sulfuriphilus]
MQSIENKMISKIEGKDRGWAFSPNAFTEIGIRSSIEIVLHRLEEKVAKERFIR